MRRVRYLADRRVFADARDLTVLHYDADFELVAEITGQAQEGVGARGSAD